METNKIHGARGLAGTGQPKPGCAATDNGSVRKPGFEQLLQSRLEGAQALQFSKHAEQRMAARRVELAPDARGRLEQAVQRAAEKGARESLVLMDRMAFVVNVPSRTVLTAMTQAQAQGGVFTKIDSTVLA